MNPMLDSNMFQSIKHGYLANAVKIHVTFHRKTNFNKDFNILFVEQNTEKALRSRGRKILRPLFM
jgi:hypothetical protein